MGKKRRAPHEEGVISVIYKKIFRPLMEYKPNQGGMRAWMEELFHYKYRSITQYRARHGFEIPGLYKEAAHRKIQGIGYRQVKRGTILTVRKDHREPDYDIEFFGGQGEKEQIFSLSESEWNSIAALLEPTKSP